MWEDVGRGSFGKDKGRENREGRPTHVPGGLLVLLPLIAETQTGDSRRKLQEKGKIL